MCQTSLANPQGNLATDMRSANINGSRSIPHDHGDRAACSFGGPAGVEGDAWRKDQGGDVIVIPYGMPKGGGHHDMQERLGAHFPLFVQGLAPDRSGSSTRGRFSGGTWPMVGVAKSTGAYVGGDDRVGDSGKATRNHFERTKKRLILSMFLPRNLAVRRKN